MSRDIEIRGYPAELRAEGGEGASPTTIEGYAAIFNSQSEDLGGFREVVMPGAFDRAIREKQDVRALVGHDPDKILGRTKAGTLDLAIDTRGLKATITPPNTQAGRDILTSVQRGDVSGMSFAFRTLTDNWRIQDEIPIRELADLELVDVSIVSYPAYTETSIAARAIEFAKTMKPYRGVPNEVNAARLDLVVTE